MLLLLRSLLRFSYYHHHYHPMPIIIVNRAKLNTPTQVRLFSWQSDRRWFLSFYYYYLEVILFCLVSSGSLTSSFAIDGPTIENIPPPKGGRVATNKSLKYADDCHTKFRTRAFIKYYRYLLLPRRRGTAEPCASDQSAFRQNHSNPPSRILDISHRKVDNFVDAIYSLSSTGQARFRPFLGVISYRY